MTFLEGKTLIPQEPFALEAARCGCVLLSARGSVQAALRPLFALGYVSGALKTQRLHLLHSRCSVHQQEYLSSSVQCGYKYI